jgi:hypothetical protein
MKLIKSDIKFKVGKKQVKFSIVHNLPNSFTLSIDNALSSWLARAHILTAENFVDYIKSKNTDCIVMTEKQYNKIKAIDNLKKL